MLQAIAKNKPLTIAALVLAVVLVIYFAGRKAGKNAAEDSWWNKLFGTGSDPETVNIQEVTVNGQVPKDNIQAVTDAIYQSIEDRTILSGNGTNINMAFGMFNVLQSTGRASVVNDWNARYLGKDKYYFFTGNWGTMRQEIAAFADEGLQPQTAIAYKWMQDNNIN